MTKFEIAKIYAGGETGAEPITVLNRTAKTVTVTNRFDTWTMRVRHDDEGNEVLIDSTVKARYRKAFTFSSVDVIGTETFYFGEDYIPDDFNLTEMEYIPPEEAKGWTVIGTFRDYYNDLPWEIVTDGTEFRCTRS